MQARGRPVHPGPAAVRQVLGVHRLRPGAAPVRRRPRLRRRPPRETRAAGTMRLPVQRRLRRPRPAP